MELIIFILKVEKAKIFFNNENYIGTHDIYFKTSKSYIYL